MTEAAGILGLTDRVRAEIHQHVFANLDREVGGVLVGHRIDERGVQVMGTIPALEAVGEAAAVTFTHKAWEIVHQELDRRFPDKQIVGWYHSHPGFGIFLSRDDLFIHESFFSKPWQFAYVIDPIGLEEGEFGWSEGSVALLQTRRISAPAGFGPVDSNPRPRSLRSRYPAAAILSPLFLGAALGFLLAPAFGLGGGSGSAPAATPARVTPPAASERRADANSSAPAARTIKPAPDRPAPPIAPHSSVPSKEAAPVQKEPEYTAPSAPAPSPEAAEAAPGGGTVAPSNVHFNDD